MADAQRRTLLVLRHAKAERDFGAGDHVRPLTARGRRDAAAAGAHMLSAGLAPDSVRCSDATRARQTWEHVRAQLGKAGRRVQESFEPVMYHADARALLVLVRENPDRARAVLLVGHNPAMQGLVAHLTGEATLDFPTAALAVVAWSGRWRDAAPGSAALAHFWSPSSARRP